MVETQSVPFRISPEERTHRLAEFNARKEILWFGFEGSFKDPGTARVRFRRMDEGALGGGGFVSNCHSARPDRPRSSPQPGP